MSSRIDTDVGPLVLLLMVLQQQLFAALCAVHTEQKCAWCKSEHRWRVLGIAAAVAEFSDLAALAGINGASR